MHWTSGDIGAVATAATAVCTGAFFVWRKGIRPRLHRTRDFLDDWSGTPARPGVKARPGVMERLESIEGQLRPNGGTSMHDAVNRIEQAVLSPTAPPEIHIHPPGQQS